MRDERLFPLYRPLSAIKGVGPKLNEALLRLIDDDRVLDLLFHLPHGWVDRRVKASFAEAEPDETATLQGHVAAVIAPHSSTAPHKVRLADDTGFLTLVYFRASGRWLQSEFKIGSEKIISGRVEDFNGERQIVHPDYVIDAESDERPPSVEPIYRLTAGLTNKKLHSIIQTALAETPLDLPEWIDSAQLAKAGWPSFRGALEAVHTPANYDLDLMENALARLAYDEALARAVIQMRAKLARDQRRSESIPPATSAVSGLLATLPYRPTAAQSRAFSAIEADLQSTTPMRRMLQGDVGSGKTLVGTMAALQAASGGFQTAVMAPTEVLAQQQYASMRAQLEPLGVNVACLTGRYRGSARDDIMMGLADGSIQVCTGTHALFQPGVAYRRLGLVIVDEQHRFGVLDRAKLAGKATAPHMLVMSATPIPRTLNMAVHGDLDISILDEKPPGRQPVETRVLPDTRVDDVVDAISRALGRGERAFWICPKVDVDDDLSSAVSRHASLEHLLRQKFGLVHGRMKPDDKDDALNAFREGETKVLVGTTVVEVGVDVPEATIMVIERAESFGLAQLHQLRGRVGRGARKSYCLLMYRAPLTETAKARLEILRATEDGFEIAEADYKIRGPGDILGRNQSGMLNFRLLDLSKHQPLLEIAMKDAEMALTRDPELTSERGKALLMVRALLGPELTVQQEAR